MLGFDFSTSTSLLLLLFFLQKHTKKNNEIEIDENMGSGAER
jgi:hypothetical protein